MRTMMITLCLAAFSFAAMVFWMGFSIEPRGGEPRVSLIQETDSTLPAQETAIGTAPNAVLNPPTSGFGSNIEATAN